MTDLSPAEIARLARQIQLPEVGMAGQRAIRDSTARGGSAWADTYARRAGFGDVVPDALDLDALAPLELVRTEAARHALAGARRALGEVVTVLNRAREQDEGVDDA